MDYVKQEYWDNSYENLDTDFFEEDALTHLIKTTLSRHNVNARDVIELGCYPGRYLKTFGDFGFRLNGIDTTPKVTKLPVYFNNIGYKVGEFIQANALEYTTNKKFDIVCSFGFIEHFKNWQQIILHHIELTKPGGLILITVPNFRGFWQKTFHNIFDKQNLSRHNLQAMVVEEWIQLLSSNNIKFEILFKGPFGKIEFWADEEKRSRYKRYIMNKSLAILNSLKYLNLAASKTYSPYLGLIIKLL